MPILFQLLYVKWSEVAQSCLTLCDPMDCSLPGSTIRRIFQARILELVAISFSRRSSWPRDWTQVSHMVGIVGRGFYHLSNQGRSEVSKMKMWGLSWWLSGKETTCQCRREESLPDPGRSTCLRATKPMCHNYWACALEPRSCNYWAHVPQLLNPRTCSRQQEKPQ